MEGAMERVGRYAFIVGVVVSVLAGFITANWIFPVLTVLGLIIGLLNVTAKETQSFLLAAVSLVIIAALGSDQIQGLPEVGESLGRIYHALLAFVSPAALVVALKSLVAVAQTA
jgi:hypothetical protein